MEWISPNSYWHATAPADELITFDRLEGDAAADTVVMGAGISGLTAALHLQASGQRVVVVEAGRVGAGTTGGTSAHLDAHPEQGADKLIQQFGESSARAVTEGRMAAIEQIASWIRAFSIDCDFHRIPAYDYSESSKGAAELKKEVSSLRRLGLKADAVSSIALPFSTSGGVRIEHQARFHSLRYLRGLARAFREKGGVIYEHSSARPPRGGQEPVVETQHGRVSARAVLVCTHSPFLGLSQFDARVAPYQSYVLTARVAETFPDALFWDDAEPYHYLRRAASDDPHLVMVGGADHKTGQGGDEREPMRKLEEYVTHRFTVETIEQRWSAELFEPDDGLPFVGAVPRMEQVFLATGYSGTGLTMGTMAGRILADLVLGRENHLAKILSPSRIKLLAGARQFLSQNLNVAQRFVSDRFTTDSIRSLEEISPGEGRLVRYRGHSLAAYRSEDGTLTTLSPACTHAGCFVQWNELEHTWDCPCHGGRYSPTGERIYGPPARNLDPKRPGEQ